MADTCKTMRVFLLAISFLFLFSTISLAEKADKRLPYREDAGLTKAEYLLSVEQWSAALETAKGVLARHPNSADAYVYQGYAYHSLGEMAAARKSFKQALLINPTHLGANKYLGDMYLEAGDVARALEQLQVIRMACGAMDCEEQRSLEYDIDRYKQGIMPELPGKE